MLTTLKTVSYNIYKEQMFPIYGRDEFMENKNYDEILLKMLNDDTRPIIIKTLKKYLKQIHKER